MGTLECVLALPSWDVVFVRLVGLLRIPVALVICGPLQLSQYQAEGRILS